MQDLCSLGLVDLYQFFEPVFILPRILQWCEIKLPKWFRLDNGCKLKKKKKKKLYLISKCADAFEMFLYIDHYMHSKCHADLV